MSKRFATQVHQQTSRLLREGLIKREPAWLQAVLDHPPLPLPTRGTAYRTKFDLSNVDSTRTSEASSTPNASGRLRPSPVQYVEDEVRRQFFRDHPFEGLRPTTLIEEAAVEEEHPIRGKEWTRLRQRGRNPTPEDAVRFAANLHVHHGMPLTRAYAAAVAQFRSLRSEQQLARRFALQEAKHYGIQFGPSQVDITFEKEEQALDSWARDHAQREQESLARKRWKVIIGRDGPPSSWTKGQEYTRLWQEGVRPTYTPLRVAPKITPAGLQVVPNTEQRAMKKAKQADFMKVLPNPVPTQA